MNPEPLTITLPAWLHWDAYLFAFLQASTNSLIVLAAIMVLIGRVAGIQWLVAIGTGMANLLRRPGDGSGKELKK